MRPMPAVVLPRMATMKRSKGNTRALKLPVSRRAHCLSGSAPPPGVEPVKVLTIHGSTSNPQRELFGSAASSSRKRSVRHRRNEKLKRAVHLSVPAPRVPVLDFNFSFSCPEAIGQRPLDCPQLISSRQVLRRWNHGVHRGGKVRWHVGRYLNASVPLRPQAGRPGN